jgi:hypothetical protein
LHNEVVGSSDAVVEIEILVNHLNFVHLGIEFTQRLEIRGIFSTFGILVECEHLDALFLKIVEVMISSDYFLHNLGNTIAGKTYNVIHCIHFGSCIGTFFCMLGVDIGPCLSQMAQHLTLEEMAATISPPMRDVWYLFVILFPFSEE